MIAKGVRVEVIKTGKTGVCVSGITYRTNAGRTFREIMVRWDVPNPAGDREWAILVRNLREECGDENV